MEPVECVRCGLCCTKGTCPFGEWDAQRQHFELFGEEKKHYSHALAKHLQRQLPRIAEEVFLRAVGTELIRDALGE